MTGDQLDQALLDLLAEHNNASPEPRYPILSEFAKRAVARGIVVDVGETCRRMFDLRAAGEIESFEVDGFGPFLAIKGRCPAIEDLPKAGDELRLEFTHEDHRGEALT